MRCGISTACFYPEDTGASLRQVIDAGAPVTELFLNTFSELEEPYVAALQRQLEASGTKAVSLHPFSSAMEGFFFASGYKARFADGVKLYRRYFEVARQLGAGMLVFHGDHRANPADIPMEEYAERFVMLAQVAEEYGVTLCHENVYYCRLGDPEAIAAIRPMLGRHAAFVLDLKQVYRQGAAVEDMLNAMGPALRHVHISDHCAQNDCVPPGSGAFDFERLLRRLRQDNYVGDLVIELYRNGFDGRRQLADAMHYVQRLIDTQAASAT